MNVNTPDPIFDVPALTSTPLNPRTLKSSERDGIVTEEIRYHSETDGATDVDIFACFSYPRGARGLPAFIWNPGGLGQACSAHTEVPAKRGFAVLCIDFPQPGYRSTGNYPINAGLDLGPDPRQAPIYHGAVALLKAVSYLASRPEVDRDRIGMAGSSWGGFFTTLMVGIDPRLKAGSCFYGTGNLQLGNAWWDGVCRRGDVITPAQRQRWSETLDPARRLANRKTPLAWFTTTNDAFYSMPALMATVRNYGGPSHVTLVPNWDHAMPAAFHDRHLYAWLDMHLRGAGTMARVSPVEVTVEGNSLIAGWDFQGDAASADLIVSFGEPGNWRGRFWHTVPAEVRGRKCTAKIPVGSLPCFVSGAVVNADGIRTSTPLRQVDAKLLGLEPDIPCPDYDGCQEWGGFEPNHIAFVERHTSSGQPRWIPKLSTDAKEGRYAAILEQDVTLLPPILYTAGLPHRFTCFMKADQPRNVAIQLAEETREFHVGTDWTEARLSMTPGNEVMGVFPATIRIPPGARILVDAIRFRPVIDARGYEAGYTMDRAVRTTRCASCFARSACSRVYSSLGMKSISP